MYPIDVDYVVRYVPPMLDWAKGLRLSRTFELPFPPSGGVSVFSKEWERIEEPLGYRLKAITWDIDKQRFLAETEVMATGVPLALIPHELRNLLDCGWAYGSYLEKYKSGGKRGRKRAKLPTMRISKWNDEEAEAWEEARSKSRPKEFKTVLHAIVATMVELQNNCSVAYAMLKTGGYVDVPESVNRPDLSPIQAKFDAAMNEFRSMKWDKQQDWCEHVQRRYPRLIDVVEAMR
jgi:hypothetical protein